MALGLTAARSPSAFARCMDSSRNPSIMLHVTHDSFSVLCAVILRGAPHQDRVASMTPSFLFLCTYVFNELTQKDGVARMRPVPLANQQGTREDKRTCLLKTLTTRRRKSTSETHSHSAWPRVVNHHVECYNIAHVATVFLNASRFA